MSARAVPPRPTVTLAELARDVEPIPAVAFQREAADRLAVLTAATGRAARVRIGGVPLHALDVVRSDLLRAGGEALGFATLLGCAPAGTTVVTPVASPALGQAAAAWRRTGRDVHVEPNDASRDPATPRDRRPPRRLADLRTEISRGRGREHAFVLRDQARRLPAGGFETGAAVAGDPGAFEVLVPVQLPGHIGDVEPVVRRLLAEGRAVGFLAADARAANAVRTAGLAVAGPRALGPRRVARVLAASAAARAEVARAVRRGPRDAASRAFGAAVERALELQLHQALLFGAGIAPVVAASTAGPVSAFLVPNAATWAGRTAGRLGLAAGVPVVGIEHGSVFPDDPRWDGLPVTTMGAWGEPSRRAFVSSGVPAARVVVTGAPRFDRHAVVPPVPRAGPVRVLVATSGAGDHVSLHAHLRFLEVLAGALEQGPKARWTVKLHPKDRADVYAPLLAAAPAHASVDVVGSDHARRASIFEHLAEADVLVTVSSTTALDALRAGVPVVVVDVDVDAEAEALPEFVARSAAVVVHDAAGLAAAVEAAERGVLAGADGSYLAEHVVDDLGDGRDATGRVVDLLGLPSTGRRSSFAPTDPRP